MGDEKIENSRKSKGGKRYKNKKSSVGKKILITLMVILIIIVIILGIAVGMVAGKIGKINFENIDQGDLDLNNDLYSEVSGDISKEEFNKIKNVALFGVDGGRSDTIMIASINQADKTIKLISIPRDTYVAVSGHGKTKINHAYAYGKEQLALKTINSNLGLNISEYVTVNFKGLINVINKIGGIELTISKEEKDYINEFVHESYELTGKSTQLLSSYGKVKLTGEQALTHARNRTVGNDFTREERQRDVLTAVMNKVSTMSLTQIWDMSDSILEEVKTNLDVKECMGIASDVLGNSSKYLNNIVSKQVPSESEGKGQTIDKIYYFVCDLPTVSKELKDILYKD